MQIHVGGGLTALLLMWLHYRSHPVKVRSIDINRRALLRSVGLAGMATLVWAGWESTLRSTGLPGRKRRFTGSHEQGSGNPALMPVTSWLDDRTPHIDSESWELSVDNRRLSFSEVEEIPRDRFSAILDCTGGWYSKQEWEGVRLDQVVDAGKSRSVVVRSATGYQRRFPIEDLTRLWLATRLGGRPLSAGHGFPVRLVAPGRRGFWWVKWVVQIEVSDRPSWLQFPFPPT
jgi:DMSO/TMAO reductase YedYZ molybdopterin-dependent catalytic subunit